MLLRLLLLFAVAASAASDATVSPSSISLSGSESTAKSIYEATTTFESRSTTAESIPSTLVSTETSDPSTKIVTTEEPSTTTLSSSATDLTTTISTTVESSASTTTDISSTPQMQAAVELPSSTATSTTSSTTSSSTADEASSTTNPTTAMSTTTEPTSITTTEAATSTSSSTTMSSTTSTITSTMTISSTAEPTYTTTAPSTTATSVPVAVTVTTDTSEPSTTSVEPSTTILLTVEPTSVTTTEAATSTSSSTTMSSTTSTSSSTMTISSTAEPTYTTTAPSTTATPVPVIVTVTADTSKPSTTSEEPSTTILTSVEPSSATTTESTTSTASSTTSSSTTTTAATTNPTTTFSTTFEATSSEATTSASSSTTSSTTDPTTTISTTVESTPTITSITATSTTTKPIPLVVTLTTKTTVSTTTPTTRTNPTTTTTSTTTTFNLDEPVCSYTHITEANYDIVNLTTICDQYRIVSSDREVNIYVRNETQESFDAFFRDKTELHNVRLVINGSGLSHIDFPNLKKMTGNGGVCLVIVSNPSLTSISFPSLDISSSNCSVQIENNDVLGDDVIQTLRSIRWPKGSRILQPGECEFPSPVLDLFILSGCRLIRGDLIFDSSVADDVISTNDVIRIGGRLEIKGTRLSQLPFVHFENVSLGKGSEISGNRRLCFFDESNENLSVYDNAVNCTCTVKQPIKNGSSLVSCSSIVGDLVVDRNTQGQPDYRNIQKITGCLHIHRTEANDSLVGGMNAKFAHKCISTDDTSSISYNPKLNLSKANEEKLISVDPKIRIFRNMDNRKGSTCLGGINTTQEMETSWKGKNCSFIQGGLYINNHKNTKTLEMLKQVIEVDGPIIIQNSNFENTEYFPLLRAVRNKGKPCPQIDISGNSGVVRLSLPSLRILSKCPKNESTAQIRIKNNKGFSLDAANYTSYEKRFGASSLDVDKEEQKEDHSVLILLGSLGGCLFAALLTGILMAVFERNIRKKSRSTISADPPPIEEKTSGDTGEKKEKSKKSEKKSEKNAEKSKKSEKKLEQTAEKKSEIGKEP